MITRVRVEASAKTEDEVRLELAEAGEVVQTQFGGYWIAQEQASDMVQSTKDGFWGRMTIEREDGHGRI